MQDKKETMERFSDLINGEIFQCISQDINFSDLQKYEKILILQSAPFKKFEEIIGEVCRVNTKADLIIVGQSKCIGLMSAYPDRNIFVIIHDKRFDASDTKLIENIKKHYGSVDAVLYFNDFANSFNFVNVEQILLSIDVNIPIYSYSYVQQELNKISNIANHYYPIILYKDLLEWFKTWR